MPTPGKRIKTQWKADTGGTVSLKTWARNSAGQNAKNWLASKATKPKVLAQPKAAVAAPAKKEKPKKG